MPGKSHQRVASSHDVMKDVDMEKDLAIPPAENFGPPSWRTVLNKRVDLGQWCSSSGFSSSTELNQNAQAIPTFTLPDLVLARRRIFSQRKTSRMDSRPSPWSLRG